MNIEDLESVTNGLSVNAGCRTLVCDRARIAAVTDTTIELSFWIVGTDIVPRLRLARVRVLAETGEGIARIVRRVARGAVLHSRQSAVASR